MPQSDPLPAEGILGRWVIISVDSGLAWSGSRWVPHRQGIPAGDAQVCNFATREETQQYIDEHFNAFYPPPIDF